MSVDSSRRSLKLVVIDSHESTADTVKTHFADRGVKLVGEAKDLKTGSRLIRGLHPDLILLEVPPAEASYTLEAVQRLRSELPESGIILTASDPSPQLIVGGMRAGAEEFVSRPIDPIELEKAIEHLRRTHERAAVGPRRRGKVISVFATKGGAGASSIATNLGVTLAQHEGVRVALVDLNFQLGDLSLLLDVKPRYGLSDVVGDGPLEENELRTLLTSHSSGVFLLTMAGTPEDGQKVERNHIIEVFGLLNSMFDFVIVDVGRDIDERTLEVLDLSDHILLLSTLNLPSIRNVKRYFDLFSRLEIEPQKLSLVVNRYGKKKFGLGIRDLQSAVGLEVSWVVPNDYQAMSHSIDAGIPLVIGAARSKIAKSFQEYADQVVEMTASPSHSDSLASTSD
jgi:pilus assembly protein CpaE